MNDEMQGALAICGFLAIMGLMAFAVGSDTGMRQNTMRFWKWWSAFWFAPLAFHLLRIVWLG